MSKKKAESILDKKKAESILDKKKAESILDEKKCECKNKQVLPTREDYTKYPYKKGKCLRCGKNA